jgi:hypothetical protein
MTVIRCYALGKSKASSPSPLHIPIFILARNDTVVSCRRFGIGEASRAVYADPPSVRHSPAPRAAVRDTRRVNTVKLQFVFPGVLQLVPVDAAGMDAAWLTEGSLLDLAADGSPLGGGFAPSPLADVTKAVNLRLNVVGGAAGRPATRPSPDVCCWCSYPLPFTLPASASLAWEAGHSFPDCLPTVYHCDILCTLDASSSLGA